uniref:SAYSvFN domain-containing protein n=1 Tax=Panagrellus redivivus TaxID=6233 RepID=A0A7E4ZTY1_PANRE
MSTSRLNKVQEQLQEFRRRREAELEAQKAKEAAAAPKEPSQPEAPTFSRVDYFAIDVLNIYPLRKWREWCNFDPWRCWIATFCFWAAGQMLFISAGFGIVYFMFSLLMAMFLNLGSRKEGEMSAYSVFNPNCERLLGQMTSEHFERDMMMQAKTN